MQHVFVCMWFWSFNVNPFFYDVLIFLPFSAVKKPTVRQGWQCVVLTHQVFPVFQSSPVTPVNESGGHSQMQSVSMFTLVSTKIWTGPVFHMAFQFFFKNMIFSPFVTVFVILPWNILVRRTLYLLLGLSTGKQTGNPTVTGEGTHWFL